MPFGGAYGTAHITLCMNFGHITELKNNPNLVECAADCIKTGCSGIAVPLHENGNFMREADLCAISERLGSKLCLEVPLSDHMIDFAGKVKPGRITFIPSEGEKAAGFDLAGNAARVPDAVRFFHDRDILVSFCIGPDPGMVELAKECGADLVEIHTGAFCGSVDRNAADRELKKIYSAADHAGKLGIKITAGHDLDLDNIEPVLAARGLTEINIGRSIISRANTVGLLWAIDEILEILE